MKNSIRFRILFPFLFIIISSLLVSTLVFNAAVRLYFEQQAKKSIEKYASVTDKMLGMPSPSRKEFQMNDEFTAHKLLRLSRALWGTKLLGNIDYAIVSEDERLFYPREEDAEYNFIKNRILPFFQANKEKMDNKNTIRFSAERNDYIITSVPVLDTTKTPKGWILIYSDLQQSQSLQKTITFILFGIMLITAAAAVFTAITISAKITKPLTNLCLYAHTIGEREFKARSFEGTGDEIEELGKNMTLMAEKLEAYDMAQKTFVQNASHELRTPLMSIQGYAEGILYGVVDDIQAAAETIIDESKRLTRLVHDLLYLSRLDTLKDYYNFEDIVLNDLLQTTLDRITGIALKEEKQLQWNSLEEEIHINADGQKLSSAFNNILENCLRYAENKVSISLEKIDRNICITIEDDGSGFEPEELNHIFLRFYKGKIGNFGLGLTIAKSIIERHNGTITVDNCRTGGATFKILLPVLNRL